MNKVPEMQEFIWKIMDALRDAMYSKELEYRAVRMVFIKYAIDNHIGATTVDDMQLYIRAQKMFSMRDVKNGIDTIIPILRCIDNAFGLNEVLSNQINIDSYAHELFGFENASQRKNATQEDFKNVMRILSSKDLEEIDDEGTNGQILAETLMEVIFKYSYRNMFASEHTTKPQLSKLASRILNVSKDDVFCDFSSGIGLSTLDIVKDKNTSIKNADINVSTLSVATMLYIMYGFKHLDMRCEDTLTKSVEEFSGNKVFVDGPWGVKLEKTSDNEYVDSFLAIVSKALNNYMDESSNAMSLVTLSANALFNSQKQSIEFRKELINRGCIKAIIALPALKMGTSVNVNLLVMTRATNTKVLLINATENQQKSARSGDPEGMVALPDKLIDRIVNTLNNESEIEGFSRLVSIDEIEQHEFNLVPSVYIRQKTEIDNTSLDDINDRLVYLYKQLYGNN